jgi:hypothetical protein
LGNISWRETGDTVNSNMGIGSNLPSVYFKSWRLVNACIIVRYIGSVEACKGRLVAAIDFD